MKPSVNLFCVLLVLATMPFCHTFLNAQLPFDTHESTFFTPCEDQLTDVLFLLNEISMPAKGELKVLAEFTRPGMRYNPLNNQKYGGCMLRIRRVANNDCSQEHYDISGYAVDQVDGQWIWHNHVSNSVKYDNVKGVYTTFVSGLGNVYFSI